MDSWAIDLAREEQVEVYSEVGENSYSYDYDYVEQKSTRDDGKKLTLTQLASLQLYYLTS